MSAPPKSSASEREDAGFTLMELAIVMSMLGLLMLVAFASMENFRSYVLRSSCVSQQRSLVTPGTLYGFENGIENADVSSLALINADLISPQLGECPLSQNVDNDDYLMIYLNGELSDVDCQTAGLEHPYHR